MSDLKTMKQNPPEGGASPLGDENLHVWGAPFLARRHPLGRRHLSMRLTLPEQYPDKPPRVRFTSEMVSRATQKILALPRPADAAPALPAILLSRPGRKAEKRLHAFPTKKGSLHMPA